jgi:hypothetical protein
MTANTWYCEVLHTEFGPLTWDDLRGMATRGTLRPQDRVRQQGGGWRVASEIDGLFVSPPGDDATDFDLSIPPPAAKLPDNDDELDFDLSG